MPRPIHLTLVLSLTACYTTIHHPGLPQLYERAAMDKSAEPSPILAILGSKLVDSVTSTSVCWRPKTVRRLIFVRLKAGNTTSGGFSLPIKTLHSAS